MVVEDWGMVRLGASVEENAQATIEELLGSQGSQRTHSPDEKWRPARADIQKYRDAFEWWEEAQKADPDIIDPDDSWMPPGNRAKAEWYKKYGLDADEQQAVALYVQFHAGRPRADQQEVFQSTVNLLRAIKSIDADQAKKLVGTALKKYEQQCWPTLYKTIVKALDDAYRSNTNSYKLWPRMVQWIKDEYQTWLWYRNPGLNRTVQNSLPVDHIVDVVTEGGEVLSKLRAENQIPQNFDVNKLGFRDFENWLMEWKRENRASESQGQVVYEYHDGWTMQKLTTPEQLQFEGDEMGHCVGGYSQSVASGSDIIYSLRDPKGNPHVTMEIDGLEGYKLHGNKPLNQYTKDDMKDDDRWLWEDHVDEDTGQRYRAPLRVLMHNPEDYDEDQNKVRTTGRTTQWPFHQHMLSPEDDPKGYWSRKNVLTDGVHHAGPLKREFEIVQIQGKGNNTPKSEYQHKVKEFLDYLREKGWHFVRSNSWYGNWDDEEGDDPEYPERIDEASDLDDWWNDHYLLQHGLYHRTQDREDAYGMKLYSERIKPGVRDWDRLLVSVVGSLVDEYDPGRYRGRWDESAWQVYHAFISDMYQNDPDEEQVKAEAKTLESAIMHAEDTLSEWEYNNEYYAMQDSYMREEVVDKCVAELERNGKWPQFEKELKENDQNYVPEEDEYWEPDKNEIYELLQEEDPDLLNEITWDKVNEYYSGDAHKFLNYLYQLIHKHGMVGPQDLPDPTDRHAGLPDYDTLSNQPWPGEPQTEQTKIDIPGTFSSTNWKQKYHYRTPEAGSKRVCQTCSAFVGGKCHMFYNSTVDAEATCDEWSSVWEPKTGSKVAMAADPEWVQGEWQWHKQAAFKSDELQIHPIDQEHNVWFDEDGNQRARWRPTWTGEGTMTQTGELEDSFLDKMGRQGQGYVAYHGDRPVGSLTYVDDPAGWYMLGTAYTHPDYREQGIFNRLVAPLRESGKPIDAYVWNNPWLKNKVRSWQ